MKCIIRDCPSGGVAHHLLRAGGKGMGLKAGDDKTVPLCNKHHVDLHADGNEIKFFERHGYRYEMILAIAETLYATKRG